MTQMQRLVVPKWALQILNNIYEIEQKLSLHGDLGNAKRNIEQIKETLLTGKIFSLDAGLFFDDPFGQEFKETRTDLEASISGDSTENLVVTEVIKPIIRYGTLEYSQVVQKGIVVVQANAEEKTL
jgi:hypothetical protein